MDTGVLVKLSHIKLSLDLFDLAGFELVEVNQCEFGWLSIVFPCFTCYGVNMLAMTRLSLVRFYLGQVVLGMANTYVTQWFKCLVVLAV